MATTETGWAVWVRWADDSETLDIECATREQAAREATVYSRQLCDGGYECTGMSFQEKGAGGSGMLAFALAILLVYLILAAQYESWTTPLAVVLSVPLVVIGAVVALNLRAEVLEIRGVQRGRRVRSGAASVTSPAPGARRRRPAACSPARSRPTC